MKLIKPSTMMIAAVFLASLFMAMATNVAAEPQLVITTDKYTYEVGEPVEITVTNIGDRTYYYPSISMSVVIVDADGNYVVAPPTNLLWVEGVIEPGESITGTWDQTYWTDSPEDFPDIPVGEQVPVGIYTAWFYDVGGDAGPVDFSIGVTSVDPIVEYIDALPDDAFKNAPDGRKKALSNKLDEVQELIDDGKYQDAIDKLVHDIVPKVDGEGHDDWITDPGAQKEILAMIYQLIDYLEAQIGG